MIANPESSAADEVARLLRRLEVQLDDIFTTGATLAATLPAARAEARLSPVVGQGVVAALCQALSAIGDARGHVVQGHRLLEKVGDTIGYTVSYGDERPKPPNPMVVGGTVTALPVAA